MNNIPTFAVNDLYTSIQGEGALAGTPMIILRLQGCNVGCPWCDTKETWDATTPSHNSLGQAMLGKNGFWARVSADKIIEHIAVKLPGKFTWVLITGGEPTLQTLKPLVDALQEYGLKVALETSGTARGSIYAGCDWVCVSPKLHQPLPIIPEVIAQADEIKTVIGKMEDIYILEERLKEWPRKPGCIISLQPVSLSKKATELCRQQVILHGWRLSLQLHRYLDIP